MEAPQCFSVVIVGGGPAGIGVATALARSGERSILLIERNADVGGVPALYKKKPRGIKSFIQRARLKMMFGEEYASWLKAKLKEVPVTVWLESKVTSIHPEQKTLTVVGPERGCVLVQANAVVLACGAREHTLDELGWVTGARTGRIYQTKGLLDVLDRHGILPMRQPVVIGSHLNAYAVAAKLKAKGAQECVVLDTGLRPSCPWYGRWYFFLRGSRPRFIGGVKAARLTGQGTVARVDLDSGLSFSCDGVVVSSDLIPNSELAWLAGLTVDIPSRRPVVDDRRQLSAPGWFVAGNMAGGFQDADWCYRGGRRVAGEVSRFLRNRNED